jgi:dolichyl-phosphate beta-glucosyltransferase
MTLDLSLVIPAFNEQDRLGPFLANVRAYLDAARPASYEVIVVDDGSHDETSRLVVRTGARWPELRLLRHSGNKGKGQAVRTGVLASAGRRVLFADADGATPIAEEAKLSAALDAGTIVAVGSRCLPAPEVQRSRLWRRAVAGCLFARTARAAIGITIIDTQCGFKMFDGPCGRELFADSQENGYLLDVELLALAARRDYDVVEVAVNWAERPGSKVCLVRDSARMLRDLWRLRRRLRAMPTFSVKSLPVHVYERTAA